MSLENFDLSDIYNIWYHHEKDNWTISGYTNIFTINNTKNFWQILNNINLLFNLDKHFFIMKNNITPIWEDKCNINGGCWSIKIREEILEKLFEKLMVHYVSNSILKNSSDDEIYGVSFCKKKNNYFVIKIWNKNANKNSIKYLNNDILSQCGNDIIYIAHLVNK